MTSERPGARVESRWLDQEDRVALSLWWLETVGTAPSPEHDGSLAGILLRPDTGRGGWQLPTWIQSDLQITALAAWRRLRSKVARCHANAEREADIAACQ